MHPLLLSSVLLAAGLCAAVFGRLWRRGDYPVCRRCEFHLAGLKEPSTCPECGKGLASARAIASGDRRRWPVPVGVTLLTLGVLSLGYALIDNPAMDPRKPVWLLDVERRTFGESRDARMRTEIKRRMDAVPSDPAVQRALGRFVVTMAESPNPDQLWHSLAARAMRTQWVSTDVADTLARKILKDVLESDVSDPSVVNDAAATYFSHAKITWDDIVPLIDRVASMICETTVETSHTDRFKWMRSAERALLSSWAESAWPTLTIDQRDLLTGAGNTQYQLRVQSRVVAGRALVYKIETHRQPLIATTGTLWSTHQALDIRINGESLRSRYSGSGLGFSGHTGGHNTIDGSIGTTTSRAVPTTMSGPAEVTIRVRTGYDIADDPSALRDSIDDWPIVQLTAQSEVLPAGTVLPGPTRASGQVIDAVLDSLSLRFEWIEDSEAANDPRLEANLMFSAPSVSLDHAVAVVQNEFVFEGNMAVNVPAGSSHGYGTWIDAQSNGDAEQGTGDEIRIDFDPASEFQLELRPSMFALDTGGVATQRIPLGTYMIGFEDAVEVEPADSWGNYPARSLALSLPVRSDGE